MEKTALLFGSTGLVGGYLRKLVENDPSYSKLTLFVRSEMPSTFKTEVVKTDFENLWKVDSYLAGDVLFCCIGTTIKKAGSKDAFRKIDYDLVLKIGEYANRNGVKHFMVISSIGADSNSNNFYLKTKGEMEGSLSNLEFERLSILRPSILLGARKEFRFGEAIGKIFVSILGPFFPRKIRKYKGIHASILAKAMLKIAGSSSSEYRNNVIYESDLLQQLGES